MSKIKLMTIVGTRPELIRLSETIKKADRYFDHVFVHTGQNCDANLNDVFYGDLELRKPDYYLGVVGGHIGQTIGNIIAKSYDVLSEIKPDALLILGDTNSALSALPAKRLKIPVFHMEAGNRCFDENLPEEINRRIVDHISDVHLPYTEHARRYLLAEGIRGEYIFVTGSPMSEIIAANRTKIDNSDVLERLKLREGEYFVLSAHREENVDNPKTFESLMTAVNALAEQYSLPVVFSVHPRSARLIKDRGFVFHGLIREMPPFAFTDYSRLMATAHCVISDSGTLPEESAISRFPAVSIRTSTERPEAVDKGAVIIGGVTGKSILQSVELAVNMFRDNNSCDAVPDYETVNVSATVTRLIQSYTEIVNKNIWKKDTR